MQAGWTSVDGAVLYGHLTKGKYEFLKLMHDYASTAFAAGEEARVIRLRSVEPEVIIQLAKFEGEAA
jgi:hypothetical protein